MLDRYARWCRARARVMKQWFQQAALSIAFVLGAPVAAEAEDIVPPGLVRFAEVTSVPGRGGSHEQITLFEVRTSPTIVWARRISSRSATPQWASSETCPQLLDAVTNFAQMSQMEFVPTFALSGRNEDTIVVTADGPSVTVWARGWFTGSQNYWSPAEYEIRGGAELPQSQWLHLTAERLGDCWSSRSPS